MVLLGAYEQWRDLVAARLTALDATAKVEFTGMQARPHCTIWEFAVAGEGTLSAVLVKAPVVTREHGSRTRAESPETRMRPRLFAPMAAHQRTEHEYAGLTFLYKRFQRLNDPRFGAIRPLDFMPATGAIMMEKVPAPSLKRLLAKSNRFSLRSLQPALDQPLRNAGEWLRHFHQTLPPSSAQPRHRSRDNFVQAVQRVSEHLGEMEGDVPFFRHLAGEATAVAHEALPPILDLSVAHCDYAPRNILVSPSARVTVLDTAMLWQAPRYMDLAYFLVNLKDTRAQIYSGDRAFSPRQLAAHEAAFLEAYFGDTPVPWKLVRLYELQATLDRWSAMAERMARPSNAGVAFGRRAAASIQRCLISRFFRRRVESLVDRVR